MRDLLPRYVDRLRAGLTDDERLAVQQLRGQGPVRRPCACRGTVEALEASPVSGVQRHQESGLHRIWSAAGGMEMMLTDEELHSVVPTARLRRVV